MAANESIADKIRRAPIKGHDLDGEPVDPTKNFYLCPVCGQAVDMRELAQLYHHESGPDHKPILTH